MGFTENLGLFEAPMWFSRWREFRADAGGAQLAGRTKMVDALRALQRAHDHPDLPGELWPPSASAAALGLAEAVPEPSAAGRTHRRAAKPALSIAPERNARPMPRWALRSGGLPHSQRRVATVMRPADQAFFLQG